MKLFTFAACLFALSATFWLLEIGVNTLNDKCEPDPPTLPERIKVTILGYLGYPPPEAPWWRPLCQLTSPDMAVSKQDKKQKHNVDVGLKKPIGARQCSGMANNSVVLARTKIKKTAPPLLYLFWSIKDILLTDPVIPDTVKRSCSAESVFGKQTRQERPLHILLDNMKRQFLQNMNNNNVSHKMVENNLEEIIRSSEAPKEGRFDKAILGPLTKSLQALSHVVVVAFQSFGIQKNTIKWSTVKTQHGLSKITAQSPTMMAEIEVDGGIDLTVYRVTGVQGLIRNVSYQTYRLTYRGLVLYDESTTCMCGPGWHL